jgi:hypothetical protein
MPTYRAVAGFRVKGEPDIDWIQIEATDPEDAVRQAAKWGVKRNRDTLNITVYPNPEVQWTVPFDVIQGHRKL